MGVLKMKFKKGLVGILSIFILFGTGCNNKQEKSSGVNAIAKQEVKEEKPKRNINVETAIKYIQAKDYESAYKNLGGFEKSNDEEGKNLLYYVLAIRYIMPADNETEVNRNSINLNLAKDELKEISLNYQGALADEVKALKNAIDAKPSIGMTRYAVVLSSWGKPSKINKTTTANVVKEQWVYYGNKYIYLEDDVVSAIQE